MSIDVLDMRESLACVSVPSAPQQLDLLRWRGIGVRRAERIDADDRIGAVVLLVLAVRRLFLDVARATFAGTGAALPPAPMHGADDVSRGHS